MYFKHLPNKYDVSIQYLDAMIIMFVTELNQYKH